MMILTVIEAFEKLVLLQRKFQEWFIIQVEYSGPEFLAWTFKSYIGWMLWLPTDLPRCSRDALFIPSKYTAILPIIIIFDFYSYTCTYIIDIDWLVLLETSIDIQIETENWKSHRVLYQGKSACIWTRGNRFIQSRSEKAGQKTVCQLGTE